MASQTGIWNYWLSLLVAIGTALLVSESVWAAAPLSDFVSQEAAFYGEIQQLDRGWQEFEQSPLAQRWRQTGVWDRLLLSRPIRRWREIDEQLGAKTGQTLTGHLRNLCAESVAVAVFVPASGGEPRGILLTRGRDADAVTETIEQWNRIEKGVNTEERTAKEGRYFARRTAASGKTVFYAQRADVFVLSDQEALVQEAVQRLDGKAAATSLSQNEKFRRVRQPSPSAGRCWMYIAPRSWDAVFSQFSDHSPSSELLLKNWQGVESLTWQVGLKPEGCHAELQFQFADEAVSEAWAKFSSSRPEQELSAQVPADALVVLGGHVQPAAIAEPLRALLPTRERLDWDKATRIGAGLLLGRDLWTDFAGTLLHNWQLYIVERPITSPDDRRRHPFVAVWNSLFPATEEPLPRALAIENVVSFGLNVLTATSTEQGHDVQLHRTFDAETSRWLWTFTGRAEGELAVELRPDRLQLTTAAAEWQSLQDVEQAGASVPNAFAKAQRQHFPEANAYGWCSLATWRTSPTRAWITHFLDQNPDTLRGRLVQDGASLFDELYGAITCAPLQLRIKVGGLINPPADSIQP